MKARNLFWLPAVLLMAACGNEDESSVASLMPIQFSAEISASRVAGDTWEVGDRIGITMSGTSIEKMANVPYVTVQTDGRFSAESTELRFPDIPSDVEFHAYYPYSSDVTDDVLTFDVDGTTDVLWAEKAVPAVEQTAAAVSLDFSHVLSKVLVRTTGFAEDVEVALTGTTYSRGTLNIADGTVAGVGEAEEMTVSLSATSNSGEFSAIFVPDASAGNKKLVVVSASEDRQWEYELTSVSFAGGTQYIYDVDRDNAGIVVTNTIIPWTSEEPVDLKDPIGGPIPLTIERYLAGKTFKPDLDYFFDGVDENGENGNTNSNGQGFGDNFEGWQWSEKLCEQCEASSIRFYYGEDGTLMADAMNDATPVDGIEVTVDEKNRTLTFSKEPFDYGWQFTDKVDHGRDECWLLFAQNETPQYGSFTLNTVVDDIEKLFVGDKFHLAFWSTKDGKYYVVNFVMAED